VPMACFPGARLGGLTRFAGWYGSYHGRYAKVPGVQALHPYGVAMRHLIRIVGTAARNVAANVLVVSAAEASPITSRMSCPGFMRRSPSWNSRPGNFGQTWDEQIKFDLCICSLGASEVVRFVI
jgi:hypothetical protein